MCQLTGVTIPKSTGMPPQSTPSHKHHTISSHKRTLSICACIILGALVSVGVVSVIDKGATRTLSLSQSLSFSDHTDLFVGNNDGDGGVEGGVAVVVSSSSYRGQGFVFAAVIVLIVIVSLAAIAVVLVMSAKPHGEPVADVGDKVEHGNDDDDGGGKPQSDRNIQTILIVCVFSVLVLILVVYSCRLCVHHGVLSKCGHADDGAEAIDKKQLAKAPPQSPKKSPRKLLPAISNHQDTTTAGLKYECRRNSESLSRVEAIQHIQNLLAFKNPPMEPCKCTSLFLETYKKRFVEAEFGDHNGAQESLLLMQTEQSRGLIAQVLKEQDFENIKIIAAIMCDFRENGQAKEESRVDLTHVVLLPKPTAQRRLEFE